MNLYNIPAQRFVHLISPMKTQFYLLLSFIVIIYGFQCDEDCEEFIFDTASLTYEIEKPLEIYQVGDTITIEYTDGNIISLNESMTDLELFNQDVLQFFDLFEVNADNKPIVSVLKILTLVTMEIDWTLY